MGLSEFCYFDNVPAWNAQVDDLESCADAEKSIWFQLFKFPEGALLAFLLEIRDRPDSSYYIHRSFDLSMENNLSYLRAVCDAGKMIVSIYSDNPENTRTSPVLFSKELRVAVEDGANYIRGLVNGSGDAAQQKFANIMDPYFRTHHYIDGWTEAQKYCAGSQSAPPETRYVEPLDCGRPKWLNHLVKGLIFGSMAASIIGLFITIFIENTSPERYWSMLMLLIAWPFAAGFTRNVHALFFKPYFRLDSSGICLRYWRPIGCPSFGMFKFRYPAVEFTIPWPEYISCRTFTHSVNSITNWESFIIVSSYQGKQVEDEIGWDIFKGGVQHLQNCLLDFVELNFRQPALKETRNRVIRFLEHRYKNPVTIYAQHLVRRVVICLLLLFGSFAAVVHFCPSDSGWFFVPFILFIVSMTYIKDVVDARGKTIIVLSSEGIRYGSNEFSMTYVPWSDLLFVRPKTFEDVTYSSSGSSTPVIQSLDLRFRDHSSLLLKDVYQKPLESIYNLIDPPVDYALNALVLIEGGRDPEEAAQEMGLF